MIVNTFDELNLNSGHSTYFQDSGSTLYYFGLLDEQIVKFEYPTIVESHIITHYLAISTNSVLGRSLRQIAASYNCVDIDKSGKVFLPNPNNIFTRQPISISKKLLLHFVGVLHKSDNTRHLIIQLL
jgi:hypothetical protein